MKRDLGGAAVEDKRRHPENDSVLAREGALQVMLALKRGLWTPPSRSPAAQVLHAQLITCGIQVACSRFGASPPERFAQRCLDVVRVSLDSPSIAQDRNTRDRTPDRRPERLWQQPGRQQKCRQASGTRKIGFAPCSRRRKLPRPMHNQIAQIRRNGIGPAERTAKHGAP